MKYLISLLFFMMACSHKPVSHFEKNYSEVLTDIPVGMEFGFVIDKNAYNFSRVTTQQGDIACDYFFLDIRMKS